MKAYRPTSILQLTLIGFSVAAVPFVLALISALLRVDDLARQSRQAAFNITHALHSGRTLVEEITGMERHARQFQVLKDPALWRLYLNGHDSFVEATQELAGLSLIAAQRDLLANLQAGEQRIGSTLMEGTSDDPEVQRALDRFPALSEQAKSLVTSINELIVTEAEAMQDQAARTQQLLLWQAAGLVPIALLLTALFTFLITRPLRQIDHSIRQLGTGDFSAPIQVRGPRDLEELGRRLDWLRKRLMELETQKIGVLRQISHELKTPLAGIREGAELLGEGVVGPLTAEQAEIAAILRDNSLLLQKRIEDLLSFSVARTPAPTTQTQPVRLAALIQQVLTDQRLVIKAKQLRVNAKLEAITVLGDQEQVRMIFDNLLSNAVKYSPVEGEIRIELRARTSQAVLDLRDQGPGIAQEDRSRIFEAFYQGAGGETGHVKGTGLGLAIAQELARLHRGHIELIDAAQGTHIRLTLPADAK